MDPFDGRSIERSSFLLLTAFLAAGGVVRNWKIRYFILTDADNRGGPLQLAYYKERSTRAGKMVAADCMYIDVPL